MIGHGAEKLPEIADSSIDGVFSVNVLDHCRDAGKVIKECVRVIKRKAPIVICCDLKSNKNQSDVGHPILLSLDWFLDVFKTLCCKLESIKVLKSRNYNPSTGKDNLDGCMIGVWKK